MHASEMKWKYFAKMSLSAHFIAFMVPLWALFSDKEFFCTGDNSNSDDVDNSHINNADCRIIFE